MAWGGFGRWELVVCNKVVCRWTYATNVVGLMLSCVVGRFKIFALVHVYLSMERYGACFY